jgi:dihydropyrimidinase
VTTLIPFAGQPFNEAATLGVLDSVSRFIDEAQRTSCLDFAVHAILSGAEDLPAMVPALHGMGIVSYKVFMAFPGQRMLDDATILRIMRQAARRGGVVMVHCENGTAIGELEAELNAAGRSDPAAYPESRPSIVEAEAVFRALALARLAECDVYIVHLSAAESVEVAALARSRADRRVFLETCPQYLLLTRDDQNRLGPLAKVSPPMREPADVDALWNALSDGRIDVLATDASGQTRASKFGHGSDIFAAPFGIPDVETYVPFVLTEGIDHRKVGATVFARTMCERPADAFGLSHRKGRVAIGLDADLVVVDPRASVRAERGRLHGNTDYSLYEGLTAHYVPKFSMQRGRPVLRDGELHVGPGDGIYLRGDR